MLFDYYSHIHNLFRHQIGAFECHYIQRDTLGCISISINFILLEIIFINFIDIEILALKMIMLTIPLVLTGTLIITLFLFASHQTKALKTPAFTNWPFIGMLPQFLWNVADIHEFSAKLLKSKGGQLSSQDHGLPACMV